MKSFTIIDVPQRSPEWLAARCGRLTGSRIGDMLAQPRRGATESVSRRDLRIQLVLERLTGLSQDVDGFVSKDMQRGIDKEPEAVLAYEALTGNVVHRTGFLAHDTLPVGSSLDGHIGRSFTGVLELKVPKSATHLSYLQSSNVPDDYIHQATHHLWITGAAWADLVSFDDRFPPPLQLVRFRLRREDVNLRAYEMAVRLFLKEVDDQLAQVQDLITAGVAA